MQPVIMQVSVSILTTQQSLHTRTGPGGTKKTRARQMWNFTRHNGSRYLWFTTLLKAREASGIMARERRPPAVQQHGLSVYGRAPPLEAWASIFSIMNMTPSMTEAAEAFTAFSDAVRAPFFLFFVTVSRCGVAGERRVGDKGG